MKKDAIKKLIIKEIIRRGLPRTHANAQLVLTSLIRHFRLQPLAEMTPELVLEHCSLALSPQDSVLKASIPEPGAPYSVPVIGKPIPE